MKSNVKEFQYNDKDFIFVKEFNDKKYGKILKAVTKKIKNFEILYFKKEHKKLSLITDEEVINYIYKKYDEIKSDVVVSKTEVSDTENIDSEFFNDEL